METIVAEQRLNLAAKPWGKQVKTFDIPIGLKVLIYREKPKKWKGPYTLNSYDGYKTFEVLINGKICS